MKFCFGDMVVVKGNLIGVVVRDWLKRTYDDKLVPHHAVYVRYFNEIQDFREDQMERYMVRHKYLDKKEIIYQSNAVNNRLDYVPEDVDINVEEIGQSPTLPDIFYDEVNMQIANKDKGIRQRAINSLFRKGITDLNSFFDKTPLELKYIRNFGEVTKDYAVDAIYRYCKKYKIQPKYKKEVYKW